MRKSVPSGTDRLKMGLWPVCFERWTPGPTTTFLIRSLNSPKKSFVDIKSLLRLEGIIKCQFSSTGIWFSRRNASSKDQRGCERGPRSQHALMPDICRTFCDLPRASVSVSPFDLPRNPGRSKPSSWEQEWN